MIDGFLDLARVVRRYRALQLSNPCQRRYWMMKSYRSKLAKLLFWFKVYGGAPCFRMNS